MSIFYKINNFTESNKLLVGLLLFLFSLIFFSWLQYAPVFSDPDSFYHIKMAELISQKGIIRDFPYLQFTVLKDNYIDHHLLYHLLMIPFIKVLPPPIGAKLFQAILNAAFIIIFFWLLNKLKIKGAFWYTLALFFCPAFLFRISLVKAQPLSLIILFLGIHFIIFRKYWPLFFLSFIYVWAYGGWFLLVILTFLYILVASWEVAIKKAEGNWLRKIFRFLPFFRRQKIIFFLKSIFSIQNFKLASTVLGGLIAGIIINPYFPKNLYFYWAQIIQIGLVNYQNKIGVGGEWYPYSLSNFFQNAATPLIAASLAAIIFLNYHRHLSVKEKYFFVVLVLFLLATIKARRNIEYLSPFGIAFAAMVFGAASRLEIIRNDFSKLKQAFYQTVLKDKLVRIFLIIVLVAVLAFLAVILPIRTKRFLAQGSNFNYLGPASEYLKEHSLDGDLVFHSDWDDFPALFYHNSKNYYIIGLDPTFMYLYNSDLYWKLVDVTKGRRANEIYAIIKNDFKASFVIITLDHQAMINNLENNFNFQKVYTDNEAIIFKVLP